MLSIIIPHFNSNESLLKLLVSIDVGISDIEVFIVDDSSHTFPNIIQTNFSFQVKVLKNKYCKGAGGARNTALELIKTEFILFADADDEFVEGWFNTIMPYLQKENDIVFFSPDGIREDGQETKRHLGYQSLVENYCSRKELDILYKFHVPWSKLFRTSFIREQGIRFDEVIASNDVMFSLTAALSANRFDVSPLSIYRVYESSDSLTKKTSLVTLKSRLDTLNRYNAYLIKHVQNYEPYLISLMPIFLRMIKRYPLKALPIVFNEFISAPTVIPISGLLRALQRRVNRKL